MESGLCVGRSVGVLGGEWGCAPLWGGPTSGVGRAQAQKRNPQTHTPRPQCLRASDSTRGEGRDGEPPPRGAPWGALATSRAAWPLPRSRGLARSSPPGTWPPRRAFGPCVSARWPGTQPPLPSGGWRAGFGENPFKASGPQAPSHHSPPWPSQRGPRWRVSVVWVWVFDLLKGFSQGQMPFCFPP